MFYLVIGIIILLVIYVLVTYNTFVKAENRVDESFSVMDVYLKKRWDLIPKIVETVKGYAKHETNTLKEIILLRKGIYDDMSNIEKIKTNEELSNIISKIKLLVENYPNLKASDSFIDLSNQLVNVENEIASSRKYYNAVVRIYNNKVEMFPNNILAKLFGFKSKSMFEANMDERENVNVNL